MKVLILSCNTGEGHNSCAAALEEECRNQNIPCDTEDALRFISPEVSRFISNWHVRIYRHAPGLFRVGYRAAEDHPAQFHEGSALYRYLTQGAEKLCGFIAGSGYDTVICTHTFAALMVSEVVKTHLPNLKTCFIATDYTCSPSVKDSSLDRYFIPASSLSGDFLGGGVTSERLRACGIPVRQMFRSSVRKEDAKRAFGIPADHKHLVMMCGSMGCGPIMSIARRIGRDLPDDQDLTIVCGTNKQLYRRLQRRFYDVKNVHVRSYVKDMALLMDSADLYLTKPGGISVTEAASMRLPMVFIDAVAGCEEYNKDFFLRTGGAVTGQTPKEIARTSLRLLSDKDALEKMGDALDAAVAHYINMHCALDDLIPFNEWFLIPYMFWFVYLIGAVAYTFFFDVPGFRRMMRFVMITYSVTLIIYFLFPTCQMLRPEVFPRDNALTRFIAGFYVFDTNTNVCPSLHVIGSMAAFFAFWYAPIFSKRGWRIASAVAAFFISISTVFMKQHSILDVAAAIPLCAIGYYFAYVRTPKKSRSAVPDVTR